MIALHPTTHFASMVDAIINTYVGINTNMIAINANTIAIHEHSSGVVFL